MLAAWRDDYNRVRPHSALANRTPEEFRSHYLALAATTGPTGKTPTRILPLSGGGKVSGHIQQPGIIELASCLNQRSRAPGGQQVTMQTRGSASRFRTDQ